MIAVTHRKLCTVPFLEQIGRLAEAGPEMVVLREKDLDPDGLRTLASDVWHICREHDVPLSVNTDFRTAASLGIGNVHVPMDVLRTEDLSGFGCVGASVHSPAEAEEAEGLGADYVIAGHVYPTACKLDREPRGTGFVRDVCSAVDIPVYAIGGITPGNSARVYAAGATGVCVMSSAMTSEDPASLVSALDAARIRGDGCFFRRY